MINSFLNSTFQRNQNQNQNVVNVFLIGGQSNMDGRLDPWIDPSPLEPSFIDQADPKYEPVIVWNDSEQQFATYEIGYNTGANIPTTGLFGFDLILAKRYHDLINETIYHIKRTVGGTSIYINPENIKGCWNVDFDNIAAGTPKLLQELHERFDIAKQTLLDNGKTLNIIGIIWNQGTSDFSPEEAADSYQVNFQNVIDYMRNDIVGNSTLPIVFATSPIISAGYNVKVADAKWAIAAGDDNSYCVDSDDLPLDPNDNLHYLWDGANTLSERYYNIIKNW